MKTGLPCGSRASLKKKENTNTPLITTGKDGHGKFHCPKSPESEGGGSPINPALVLGACGGRCGDPSTSGFSR